MDPERTQTRSTYNGWWMFYKDQLQNRVPRAGEDPEQSRKRCWVESRQEWSARMRDTTKRGSCVLGRFRPTMHIGGNAQ